MEYLVGISVKWGEIFYRYINKCYILYKKALSAMGEHRAEQGGQARAVEGTECR